MPGDPLTQPLVRRLRALCLAAAAVGGAVGAGGVVGLLLDPRPTDMSLGAALLGWLATAVAVVGVSALGSAFVAGIVALPVLPRRLSCAPSEAQARPVRPPRIMALCAAGFVVAAMVSGVLVLQVPVAHRAPATYDVRDGDPGHLPQVGRIVLP